jgi:DNA-binding NarL/FixJ family response regulator
MEKDLIETKNNSTDKMIETLHQIVNLSKLTDKTLVYDEKKRKITVQGKNDHSIITTTIEQTEHGCISNVSDYKKVNKKSDYKNDIKDLYVRGYKQVEIAQKLGISQSLVSKLLKE